MTGFEHPIPFVEQLAPVARLCWQMGWHEGNAGNFSWRLRVSEVEAVLPKLDEPAADPVALPQPQPSLEGEHFLVTASGRFFRHATERPDELFGLLRIVDGGTAYQLLWGYEDGGLPTSELPTHLAGHAVRKRVSDGRERVILHCHPPELIILSYLMPLDSAELSMALWQKMPECIVFFPDGVRVVPPLLPGTTEIADASAIELEKGRIISWSHHGLFASEASPDAVFALVESIEKAAGMHRKVLSAGGARQAIGLDLLRELTDACSHLMVCEPEFLTQAEARRQVT
jgi:rhamnulose-1-phosphate aldolase